MPFNPYKDTCGKVHTRPDVFFVSLKLMIENMELSILRLPILFIADFIKKGTLSKKNFRKNYFLYKSFLWSIDYGIENPIKIKYKFRIFLQIYTNLFSEIFTILKHFQ